VRIFKVALAKKVRAHWRWRGQRRALSSNIVRSKFV
jgi:hypothetical protein